MTDKNDNNPGIYVPPQLRQQLESGQVTSNIYVPQKQAFKPAQNSSYKQQSYTSQNSQQPRNFDGFNQLKTVGGGLTASEAMIYPPIERVLFDIEKRAIYESFDGMKQDITFPTNILPTKNAESIIDLQLPDIIMKNMARCHYSQLTPIQTCSIPIIQAKHDILALANTGAGKTAAFAIPIIQNLITNNQQHDRQCRPKALIIVPTRELAIQTTLSFYRLSFGTNLKVRIAYGGDSKYDQMQPLKQGCDILIGTPGRLNDFLKSSVINFEDVKYLVLDEMDRCFEDGFEIQVKTLVKTMPTKRQTLLFSATNPPAVLHFVKDYTNNVVQVKIGDSGVCKQIVQKVMVLKESQKFEQLVQLIEEYKEQKILVFTETKRKTGNLAYELNQKELRVEQLHGDMEQKERTMAMSRFKAGSRILICTDVAQRGIDLSGIGLVINYDLPKKTEDYTHRIGRTGRVGTAGVAISFVTTPVDYNLITYISQQIKENGGEISEDLQGLLSRNNFRGSRDNGDRREKSAYVERRDYGSNDRRDRGGNGRDRFSTVQQSARPESLFKPVPQQPKIDIQQQNVAEDIDWDEM
ncbi:ATP-dependent RNA helicase [Spironucleus salmonicida]|uniref:ATP-dependent RNA helicase n=1 Tax=Spironucleus salmonicida TaxID=348837 RepID=V6LR82_9EUKA|nr:ATP-dependent RNA helicase [Spironucleus salmonicida]|eukprot:EST46196.1 ATP-dependent RNA helicase [Spironucleus salmonicida]